MKKKIYFNYILIFFIITPIHTLEIKNLMIKYFNLSSKENFLNCEYFYYVKKQLKLSNQCKIKFHPNSIHIVSLKNYILIEEPYFNSLKLTLNFPQISLNRTYFLKKDSILSSKNILVYYYKEDQLKFLQITFKDKKEMIFSFEYGKFVIKIL